MTRQAEGLLYMARKRLILPCRAGATRGGAPWSGLSRIRSTVVCARGHACAFCCLRRRYWPLADIVFGTAAADASLIIDTNASKLSRLARHVSHTKRCISTRPTADSFRRPSEYRSIMSLRICRMPKIVSRRGNFLNLSGREKRLRFPAGRPERRG
jgi:hypothetical protein